MDPEWAGLFDMRRRILQAMCLGLFAFAAGCDFVRSCTLIGCMNGLIVQLSTQPTSPPYRVEITGSGFGAVHVYECTHPTNCSSMAIFEDYFPDVATVKVITTAGTTTTHVTPVYKESQPNGRGCGPTCRQASVTVPFPGG